MAEVKILIEGHNSIKTGEGEEKNLCTITLIKDEKSVIVVDPGVLSDKNILIDALEKEGLKIEDVTHVFITHSHIDHYRNAGMFPASTKVLEYWGIWAGETVNDWSEKFSEDIRIIKTPGHSQDSLTFLVETEKGTVAIVGDLWWMENYPKNDPYASDNKALEESRLKVLRMADHIIPGHGKMFPVGKK